jgi:uncharacterized DUF497 family protein
MHGGSRVRSPRHHMPLGRSASRAKFAEARCCLEEAATVFDDPLFVLQDASRTAERRDAAIGFSSTGRLLTVVHIEVHDDFIRLISARRASPAEETTYAQ